MKKSRNLLGFILAAVILTGCTAEEIETEVTETTTETSVTTQNEYLLTRGWDGKELLESIFYCGSYHPLPMSIEDNPDFTLSDGVLYLPDGSFVEVVADENGTITELKASADTAPADFSIYGVDFRLRPAAVSSELGFATSIYGSEDDMMTFEFTGNGFEKLVLEFNESKLTAVYILS